MRFLLFLFLLFPIAVSADAGHIVISEIQTYGVTSKDDFVRLYNSTANPVDISGWKLKKKTASGSEYNLVSSFEEGTIVPADSDFLITHKTDYQGAEPADATFSGATYSIADTNIILLYNNEGVLVDSKTADGAQETNSPETPSEPEISDDQRAPINSGDIVINEVVPNPQEGKEWIEFYNTTDTIINVEGWKVKDGSNEIYTLVGAIYPHSFITIEINNRLNNGGDVIYLSDAARYSISQLAYGDWREAQIKAPEKGQSISRLPDGDYAISNHPTKNYENQISSNYPQLQLMPTSTIVVSETEDVQEYIIINEIFPNPEGSDIEKEWIELFNGSINDINLGGFFIDDEEGGSKPHQIPNDTIIRSNDFLLFPRTKTNIALNNDTDSVRILDSDKNEIINVEYDGAKEQMSYAYINDEWRWTSNITPLKKNLLQIIEKSTTQTSVSAPNTATGLVVVPPNLFSTRIMYIDGLQLYMHTAEWPELNIGDKIRVSGTPSTYYNEPRLKLKDKNFITVLSKGNSVVPEKIIGDDIDEEYIGKLITVEGETIESSSTKLYLDINGLEIPIYNKTDLKFSEYQEQDILEVTGILSIYKDDYRIIPRDKNDIKIIKTTNLKNTSTESNNNYLIQYIISTLIIGSITGGIYLRKRKKIKNSNQIEIQ